ELRHADPPRLRHERVPRGREARLCATGRDARRGLRGQGVRSRLGACLRAARALGVAHRRAPQRAAVPHHPPLSDFDLRGADRASAGGGGMAVINFILDLLLQAVQMVLVLLVAPLVLGVTRKVKARLLRRTGPDVWQPYRDLWKLLHKEAVLAHNASRVYRAAPYLMFALTWAAAALVPTYAANLLVSWSAHLTAQVARLASGRLSGARAA